METDHEQDSEYDGEDAEPLQPQVRPYWNRNKIHRYEHEIDILLSGIAGALLAGLLVWKLLRP